MSARNQSQTPRQPYVQLVCPECGVVFSRPAWRVRQGAAAGATLRCSYACTHAARRTNTLETKAEYHRAYRERNRERINEKQNAARFGPRRNHILAVGRECYVRNADKNRERARIYASEHREEATARRKAWPAQNPDRALFHQARSNISQSAGVPARQIPATVVEAKVAQLKVRRLIRDSDTRRMAETAKQGSVRSTGSAVPQAIAQTSEVNND